MQITCNLFKPISNQCSPDIETNQLICHGNHLTDFYKVEILTLIGLKSDSHLPKKNCVIYLIESPLKMMKNAFYFILKALFVLKIFKFLSQLFGHEGKTTWSER